MLNLVSILKAGFIGGLGALSVEHSIESEMKRYNTDILKPVDKVSIVMTSYNEADFIETTLSSIRQQSIIQQYPEYFEIILGDSCSTDGTIDIAMPYVDRIIITPKGKLTTRNEATNYASGNIIVSVDADTFYSYNWLNTLLEPFNNPKDPSIIAVSGSTFEYSIPNIPNELCVLSDTSYIYTINKTRMSGRNSAYWKHAFYLAGRFKENIDQFDIWEVLDEEEIKFGRRLATFGDILQKLNASCYHLGGLKTIGRFTRSKQIMDRYQFGKDRF